MKPRGVQKTSKVLLLSQVDPSFGASTWPNTRLKTFRKLEDTCIEILELLVYTYIYIHIIICICISAIYVYQQSMYMYISNLPSMCI